MARDMVQVRRGSSQSYRGPDARIGRSQFDRSHGLKMTFDASYLYPILVDEVLPGDTFTCQLDGFARIFSPLDAPVMDNLELETFFFFVPNRLLWDNWENFMGAHTSAGAQDTTYTIPVMATGVTVDHDGSTDVHAMAAYMGLPHGMTSSTNPWNTLPFRAYHFIYNEWFRDQNLTNERGAGTGGGHEMGDGPDAHADYTLQRSNKKHDYFTSALPYLQKGTALTAAVTVLPDTTSGSEFPTFQDPGKTKTGWELFGSQSADPSDVRMQGGVGTWTAGDRLWWDDPNLNATLDINALRQGAAIQRLLEIDARGGTRYTEIIKAHFGVTSPDFRLQRPEYLGGGKSFINITPVANTSATATEDQAELRGVGTGVVSGHGWAKSFTEHGVILGLVRARGDITYFQGVDRMWTRSTRYDFYIPALAMLGEQSVLNQEIFISNDANDLLTFGYQERWAEYRQKPSRLVATFNPDVAGSLSHWHLAEDFSSLPSLNTAFVNDNTPMSRITTIDTEHDFLLDVWFNYKCARPLPVRSIPSLLGRF